MTEPKLTAPDYAQLGAELDCDANETQLSAFATKYHMSTDQNMATLATFARFKLNAVRARLAGNIENALVQERNADKVHEGIPSEYRW